MPLVMTAFGNWEVGHQKIIGINVLRTASHVAGVGTYVNRGQILIRFADGTYMDEYARLIGGRTLVCDQTGSTRELRSRPADRDLDLSRRAGRDMMLSARFFDEVWDAYQVR